MPPQRDLAPFTSGVSSPMRSAFAITPNDDEDLECVTRALYVGKTGDIAMCLIDDKVAVTIAGVKVGTVLPLRIKKIMATGTTSEDLVGLF